ncbi:MAG: hypothetical protein IPM93_24475 [Candidatus Obscuribacter sp.]|nr:hypothetical protein [Candidatus Obscuribacter sp.]
MISESFKSSVLFLRQDFKVKAMVHKFELGTNQNPAHKFPQRFPFVALFTSLTLAAGSCLFLPYGAEAADTTVDQAIVKAAIGQTTEKNRRSHARSCRS